jgi:hypothetical protein
LTKDGENEEYTVKDSASLRKEVKKLDLEWRPTVKQIYVLMGSAWPGLGCEELRFLSLIPKIEGEISRASLP